MSNVKAQRLLKRYGALPDPQAMNTSLLPVIGLVAGCCTSAASIPQIITAVKTKQVSNVSPWMFIVLLTGNALWAYYGFARKDLPILLTNCVSVLLDCVMLWLRWKYRQR
jgi:MtN3 and saliva related transmembrane protein